MTKNLHKIKKCLRSGLFFLAFIGTLMIFTPVLYFSIEDYRPQNYPGSLWAKTEGREHRISSSRADSLVMAQKTGKKTLSDKKISQNNQDTLYERFPLDREKINHKYKLQELLKKKVEKALLETLKETKLKKEGLVSSGCFQIRVVTLTPEGTTSPEYKHPDKVKEVKFDSPVSILNPYYKKLSDDAYFQAVIRMHHKMTEYRRKQGLVPNLPRDLTMDILFLNKLRIKKRLCDPSGNCLFIFALEKHGLLQNLESLD